MAGFFGEKRKFGYGFGERSGEMRERITDKRRFAFGESYSKGGGYYAEEQETVMEIVNAAVEAFIRDSADTLARIGDPNGVYVVGDIYAFALRGNFNVSHPVRKDLENTDISEITDINGYVFGKDLVGATLSGSWIDYYFNMPDQSHIAQKHTYCRRVPNNEEYVLCAGYYEE